MEVSGTAVGNAGDDDTWLGLPGTNAVVARDVREGEPSSASGDVEGGAELVVVVGGWGGGCAAVVAEGNYFVLDVAQRVP